MFALLLILLNALPLFVWSFDEIYNSLRRALSLEAENQQSKLNLTRNIITKCSQIVDPRNRGVNGFRNKGTRMMEQRAFRWMNTLTNPPFQMILHPDGELISDHIMRRGAWEPENIDELRPYLTPLSGQVVLNAGANIGSYSLYYAAAGYQVFAIEPEPTNFMLLNCSAHVNGLFEGRLRPLHLALNDGGKDSACIQSFVFNYGGSIIRPDEKYCVKVPAINLGTFIAHRHAFIKRFALLLLDVEGFEPMIIRTLQQIFEKKELRPKIIYMEFSCNIWNGRHNTTCEEMTDLIVQHGYALKSPFEAVTDLDSFFSRQRRKHTSPNLLFLSPEHPLYYHNSSFTTTSIT